MSQVHRLADCENDYEDSKEWVRQPMVDEAAHGIVAAGRYSVIDVTAYQVSKTLGCEANGSLHAKGQRLAPPSAGSGVVVND